MSLGTDDWIGLRVARIRLGKNPPLSQTEAANRAGMTQGWFSKIESGYPVDKRSTLIRLAEALEVPVTALTNTLPHERTRDEITIHKALPRIWDALDGAEEVEPRSYDSLATLVDNLAEARMACDYATLAAHLAPAIAGTQALAEAVDDRAWKLFGQVCTTASLALRPFGQLHFSTRLAERALAAGQLTDDPLVTAGATYALSQCALSGGVKGLRKRAYVLADKRIATHPISSSMSDAAMSWAVMLHLQAGLAAAVLDDGDTSRAHFAEAADLVTYVTSDPVRMDVTPDNVLVWRVAAALEHDVAIAPELAARVRIGGLKTTQRKVHFLLHQGYALALNGATEAATSVLLEADKLAPGEVRSRSRVRDIVGSMLREQRRQAGSSPLRDLAVKVGADPLAGTPA